LPGPFAKFRLHSPAVHSAAEFSSEFIPLPVIPLTSFLLLSLCSLRSLRLFLADQSG
jgi:hypothetical protein